MRVREPGVHQFGDHNSPDFSPLPTVHDGAGVDDDRDLKHTVDVRPVYHRKRDRIKAHVLLCWLALLLIRVTENQTNDTWGNLKQTLWGLMAGQHRTQHGIITQSSTPLPP